jgi:DNA-binding response OmpR family regulator
MGRILVVDDDAFALDMLKANLEGVHTVEAVGDGAQALRRAHEQAFDLLLLDVEMPELDGYSTCLQLRAGGLNAHTPVMFLSGRTELDERLRGYAVGAQDYLSKPFEVEELLIKADRLIAQHRAQQSLTRALSEAKSAALASANRVDETTVLLDFLRAAGQCQDALALVDRLIDALQAYGFEACVRVVGAGEAVSRSARGAASALECNLLDHLQARDPAERLHAFGAHTGFHGGRLLLFVRGLAPDGLAGKPATQERPRRLRDLINLLLEGALQRLAALDERAALQRRVQQAQQGVDGAFGALERAFEQHFVPLGLSPAQEDQLIELLRQQQRQLQAQLRA